MLCRRDIGLLPWLAGGQQHELGQLQYVGEPSREREVAVVDRIERTAEQTDPAGQGSGKNGRIQIVILCRDNACAGVVCLMGLMAADRKSVV